MERDWGGRPVRPLERLRTRFSRPNGVTRLIQHAWLFPVPIPNEFSRLLVNVPHLLLLVLLLVALGSCGWSFRWETEIPIRCLASRKSRHVVSSCNSVFQYLETWAARASVWGSSTFGFNQPSVSRQRKKDLQNSKRAVRLPTATLSRNLFSAAAQSCAKGRALRGV